MMRRVRAPAAALENTAQRQNSEGLAPFGGG